MAFDSRPPSRYLPAYITSQDLRAEKRRIREGKKTLPDSTYYLISLLSTNTCARARTEQNRVGTDSLPLSRSTVRSGLQILSAHTSSTTVVSPRSRPALVLFLVLLSSLSSLLEQHIETTATRQRSHDTRTTAPSSRASSSSWILGWIHALLVHSRRGRTLLVLHSTLWRVALRRIPLVVVRVILLRRSRSVIIGVCAAYGARIVVGLWRLLRIGGGRVVLSGEVVIVSILLWCWCSSSTGGGATYVFGHGVRELCDGRWCCCVE